MRWHKSFKPVSFYFLLCLSAWRHRASQKLPKKNADGPLKTALTLRFLLCLYRVCIHIIPYLFSFLFLCCIIWERTLHLWIYTINKCIFCKSAVLKIVQGWKCMRFLVTLSILKSLKRTLLGHVHQGNQLWPFFKIYF